MKKCPFCAEEIQEEALKCRYCGESLTPEKKEAWYFKTSIVVIALLSVGPLGLPLVWWHPSYSLYKKWVLTLIVLILSLILGVAMQKSMTTLKEQYAQVFALLDTL